MNKNHSVLKDKKFKSGTDYSDGSDKRSFNERKSAKLETKIDLESTWNFFQPTLEPMQIKEEKHEIDGMFQFISFLLIL